FVAPQTNRETLIAFYRKVRPFGPGWGPVRMAAGESMSGERGTHESIPLALLGWMCGCAVIWSSLFDVGSVLYSRWSQATLLTVVFLVSGSVLLFVINRLWSNRSSA